MSASLPRYLALKSKKHSLYLGYFGDLNERLTFTDDQVVSLFAKFEVEKVETDDSLVHIRCCRNKYWVVGNDKWIKAAATGSNEGTLFKAVQVSDSRPDDYRFQHVQSRKFARLTPLAPYFLCAESSDPDTTLLSDVFTVIHWDSLPEFSRPVAFKGNNDMYLRPHPLPNDPTVHYLQFSAEAVTDDGVSHEVFSFWDGTISIANSKSGKFWRRSYQNLICADSELNQDDNDMKFRLEKRGDSRFTLQNLGNLLYCTRVSIDGLADCLKASMYSVIPKTMIEVECINQNPV